jgi:hypothetical protein
MYIYYFIFVSLKITLSTNDGFFLSLFLYCCYFFSYILIINIINVIIVVIIIVIIIIIYRHWNYDYYRYYRHATTVLHLDECQVIRCMTEETDGYTAVQLGIYYHFLYFLLRSLCLEWYSTIWCCVHRFCHEIYWVQKLHALDTPMFLCTSAFLVGPYRKNLLSIGSFWDV